MFTRGMWHERLLTDKTSGAQAVQSPYAAAFAPAHTYRIGPNGSVTYDLAAGHPDGNAVLPTTDPGLLAGVR